MQKVLFIFGPTGVGKSKMAVWLAQKFNGEIISSDSVQIYRGFDIGSAKVTTEEMAGVKHYNIDICDPSDYFSVSDFVDITRKEISEISSRGKLPIVVGGTGLYVSALLGGYNFGGTNRNEEYRRELEKEIERYGLDYAYQKLEALDKTLAEKIDRHNKVRVIRGLEIAKYGEKQTKSETPYDYKIIALSLPREVLYQRIDARTKNMVENGLVKEVKALLEKGVTKSCQPMSAIGYKETVKYLEGEISLEQMQNEIKQNTRHYAKRQITYLRSLSKTYKVSEVDVTDFELSQKRIEKEVKEWL